LLTFESVNPKPSSGYVGLHGGGSDGELDVRRREAIELFWLAQKLQDIPFA
jgi:hypothetical protein